MSKGKEVLKILLYRLHLLNLLTKMRYNTYHLLKEGYNPKKFWNGWSDDYSKQKAQQRIGKGQYWLLNKIEELKPRKVLEVGCGFGKNLNFILEHLSFPASLVGFDLSESMIRKAKKVLSQKAFLGCGDINRLPFRDQVFDLVFTHATLMHVSEQNIKMAIQELQRVTKTFVIIVEETYWSKGNFKGKTLKPNDYTFIYDYEELVSQCGLEIEEMEEVKGDWNLICLLCKKGEYRDR